MTRRSFALGLLALLAAAPGNAGPEGPAAILTRLEDVPAVTEGVSLLVFFSTECVSCYEDLFEMRYLVEKNGWPVSVVGIAAGVREDLEVFLEKHAWPFPVVWDRKKSAFKRFGVRNAPFKLVLAAGAVVHRDDVYQDFVRRRAEVAKFLGGIFARFR
jgi:hypothetical protein